MCNCYSSRGTDSYYFAIFSVVSAIRTCDQNQACSSQGKDVYVIKVKLIENCFGYFGNTHTHTHRVRYITSRTEVINTSVTVTVFSFISFTQNYHAMSNQKTVSRKTHQNKVIVFLDIH